MRIAILGFGREGTSLLRFLRKERVYKGSEIVILDEKAGVKAPRGIAVRSGKNYLRDLGHFDVIFRSPGAPYMLPVLQSAKKRGAVISSATKLFFAHCPATIIGITGTKGKGTTATLLYRMLKAAGHDVYLAGNIGLSALDILPKLKKTSLVVLELSSFQLQDLERSPHVAVILETFPDHQDAHRSVAEYYRAKANIAAHQKARDSVFFFPANTQSRMIAKKSKGKKIAVRPGTFRLFTPRNLRMPGAHNFRNAVMAATVAKRLGVHDEAIRRAAASFKGNEHRLEFVKRTRGISFYNDSASTTPESLAAAIQSFPNTPSVVIAGGKDKGLDYASVTKALRATAARELKVMVLLGENKKKIRRAIAKTCAKMRLPIREARTLQDAVRAAYQTAKEYVKGDQSLHRTTMPRAAVIFSPGATSFDMFENYAARGSAFKGKVDKLQKATKV